ncbi:MAG: hypothetical protein HC900_02210 [Methylacidiphilales bacterium]|nr:hypothetical protein [Candidatus Methylacidiphilales bacterium]
MNIHDVTELIWHFVGHLRLDEDVARNRIQYEDAESGRVLEDDIGPVKEKAPRLEELVDSESSPIAFASFPGVPPIPNAGFPIGTNHAPPVPVAPVEDIHFKVPPRLAPAPAPGSISGHGYPESIGPEYRETLFDARQINQINDCDIFSSDPMWDGVLPAPDKTHSLDELLAAAQDEIPAGIGTLSGGSSQAAIAFARSLGNEESDGQFEHSTPIEPGKYHNGERLAEDEELPTELSAIVPEMPEPTNGPTGDLGITTQAAELGANGAYNAALIADANGACGTLVVLGDKFTLNAIIQINVYSDDDHINAAGIVSGEVSSGGNQANNIAEVSFTETEIMPGAKTGTPFRVDIVEGDFYDVRALFQSNDAVDNDAASLTSSGHYCLVQTGGNQMFNLAEMRDFDFTNYYDVIVVGGRYYDINMIVQINALLDNDAISVGGSDDGSGTVNTGGNSLLNSAQLAMYGAGNVQPLEDGMHDFAGSLASGSPSGASSDWGFSDGGDGYIDVLYVTGDYFDINLLWQMNVVSDVDAAVLDAAGSSSEGGTTQVVSTGANELQNEAIIVDVGAISGEYIGGNVYEGSILIQANLVESDDDTLIGDTDTLATEVIAFMDGPDTAPSDPTYVGPPITVADQIMSGLMTG